MIPTLSMQAKDLGGKGGVKRPLLYIAAFLCAGIALSGSFRFPSVFYPLVISAAFLAFTCLYLRNRIISHLGLYAAVFFLGIALLHNSNTLPPDAISLAVSEEPKKVYLRGVVADDPVAASAYYDKIRTGFTLRADFLKEGELERQVSGLVRVNIYLPSKAPVEFGDKVMIEGFLSRPLSLRNPGLFNYSRYLETKGIYAVLAVKDGFIIKTEGKASSFFARNLAYRFRHWIRDSIDKSLDAQYGSFLKAILIGDRSDLDFFLQEDFVKTGTVHILAISGLHIGLIAGIVLASLLFLRIPRKAGFLLTLIFLVFYSFAAGSNPPILRATIIFGVLAIGKLINREPETLNSLGLAAILVLLRNPKELFDPSFQLSFVSVASIIIFSPGIDKLFGIGSFQGRQFIDRAGHYALKGASVSIAAWIGTWPFIAAYFNIISPVAVIANLVVIPMLFMITAASFLFLLAGGACAPLAGLFGQLLMTLEKSLFFINHLLSILPFAYFRISAPSFALAALYYGLIALFFLPHKKHILLALLLAANVFVWKEAPAFNRDILRITFLDVGQGDSIFIEFPKGRFVLIDGGSKGEDERSDMGRNVVGPYLWNKGIYKIDAVIVTHFHDDHLGGVVYILKNFKVGCVIDNGAAANGNKLYDEYLRIIRDKQIRHITAAEGDRLGPFGGASLFILNPEKENDGTDSNDNSVVAKLTYKDSSALLCGDSREKTIGRLSSYGDFLKSDLLKVPHHGGDLGGEGIVKNFLQKVSPEVSVISVGRRNNYNAPSEKTLDILASTGSVNYLTRNNGAVIAEVDSPSGKGAFVVRPFVKS